MMRRVVFALAAFSGSALAAPAAPPSSPAAKALIDSFASELAGKVLPAPAIAGEYAMALDLSFDTYPTTEMHITERRKAAMRLTLTPAGTARACVGMAEHHTTSGQYRYKPAAEREPSRTRENIRLLALAGTWRTLDGVATIELDQIAWNTCDLAAASKMPTPFAKLRCIGAVANPSITVATLMCEAEDESQLLGVGLPMTPASRTKQAERFEQAPRGKQIILGAPGLLVKVEQSRGPVAKFSFKGDAVNLVEKDFIAKPKPPPRPPRPPPPRPKPSP
jgi:hypothetical protein